MRCLSLIMSVVILLSTGCTSIQKTSPSYSSQSLSTGNDSRLVVIAPDIPFSREDAFFPLRRREDGKILPSYQYKECAKRVIVCLDWKIKTVFFEELDWFMINGMGLMKRKSLLK